jgi:hypothetical protein
MRRTLVLRGGLPVLLGLAVMVAVTVTAAVVTGYQLLGSIAATGVLLAWLVFSVRVRRTVLAGRGPRGDGPAPPGGAGVREPRRPRPQSPAGAAELPGDDEDSRRAVAIA